MLPEGLIILQKTTPTKHQHYEPGRELILAEYSPNFEGFPLPLGRLTFHLHESARDCGHTHLLLPRRWSR